MSSYIKNEARRILKGFLKRKNQQVTRAEFDALLTAIQYYYLDTENYPKAFNLRIARRFDNEQLDEYFTQASASTRGKTALFEESIYSKDGSFYFGFTYNLD